VGFSARADAAADTVAGPITCVVLLVPERLSLGLEIVHKLVPVIVTQCKYIPIFLHTAAALLITLLLLICLFCAFVFVVFAILIVIVLFLGANHTDRKQCKSTVDIVNQALYRWKYFATC
jgi:hypothetical protein